MKATTNRKKTSQQKLKAVKTMLFMLNRSGQLACLVEWAEIKHHSRQGKKYYFIQKSYECCREEKINGN